MSLRIRLNLLVTVTFVTILALGAAIVIHNARRAVAEETQSTASLALQLLELAFTGVDPSDHDALRARLLDQMENLESARHLHVALVQDSGTVSLEPANTRAEAAVPGWFVDWVEPEATEFRRTVDGSDGSRAEIVVRADPADEITESWEDARTVLGLVLLFSFVANALLYVMIGRWLRPLETVVAAMDRVEQGDYRSRLSVPPLPELANVARQFNRMAEVLERSREENRRLSQKTLAIQEEERRALAHELHDELGQSISAIKAVAVSISQTDPTERKSVESAARTIADISNHIYSVVRGIMTRLRPVLLDEFGLVPALDDLADTWNSRFPDTFCRLATEGSFDDLDDEIRIGVYRIVQECLTNIGKHAQASEIDVTLERRCAGHGDGEHAVLIIRDDGVGFDADNARSGLGLLGIRERVEALGGHFELVTARGSGVTIAIEVPVTAGAVA